MSFFNFDDIEMIFDVIDFSDAYPCAKLYAKRRYFRSSKDSKTQH